MHKTMWGHILLTVSIVLAGSSLTERLYPVSVLADPVRSDWQPVATLDVNQSIQVQIVNQLGEPLEYLLRKHTDNRTLPNGQKVTLQVTSLPAYLSVNPSNASTYMDSQVSVKHNLVNILVRPATGRGARAIEINQKGEVFAY